MKSEWNKAILTVVFLMHFSSFSLLHLSAELSYAVNK